MTEETRKELKALDKELTKFYGGVVVRIIITLAALALLVEACRRILTR